MHQLTRTPTALHRKAAKGGRAAFFVPLSIEQQRGEHEHTRSVGRSEQHKADQTWVAIFNREPEPYATHLYAANSTR